MCMEDVRLGRAIKYKATNYTTNATIPADARRVGILMVPTNQPDLARYFSLNVKDVNNNTACIARPILYAPMVYLDIKQHGQLIQGPIDFINESGAGGATITEFYLEKD